MEEPAPEKVQVEDILERLKEEGIDPSTSADEQLCYVWQLFLRNEDKLRSASQDLENLRQQQAEEMREVENYVGHVRSLTAERDAFTTEFEKENEQLRIEFTQLQLQQEAQLKEVEEMLEQEGLSEIAHSSPSEQIAYLLVERTTLLEKLEIADQKLDSHSYVDGLCAAQLQDKFDHIHQTLEDELQQQRESMQHTKETMNKSHNEELEREKVLRKRVERDLDEAARRLQMAHEEIRRLTDELDMQKKEQSKLDPALRLAPQTSESWREEMNKLKDSDRTELQKAMEHNNRLDKEILALRSRVRSLDSERKVFLELVEKLKEEICEYQKNEKPGLVLPGMDETEENACCSLQMQDKKDPARFEEACAIDKADSSQERRDQNNETVHKRCRKVIDDIEGRNFQLLHKLQKLQREHEDLVERNEELESILGETQNQTREEREHLEGEIEGLHRKITSLETELLKAQMNKTEASMKDQETTKKVQDFQEMLKSHQEKVEVLESKLSEERDWRKQLASDLEKTQKALKAEKKELHNSKSELVSLYNELQNLRGAAEERDFLNVTHEKLQQENTLLETKVSELSQECEQLNQLVVKQKIDENFTTGETTYKELMTKERILEEQIQILGGEREQLCTKLLESNKKTEALEKEVKGSSEEKQLLLEENAQLRQDILATREQFHSKIEEAVSVKSETSQENQPLHPLSSECNTALNMSIKQYLSGERLLQQHQEEMQQLRQDFHRVQNLCSSAEKELRYEREKNLDLKKHNILLQQESTKVKAELRQVQLKLTDSTKMCSSLTVQWEHSQQKVKELELELLKHSQSSKLQSSLQEKLALEKSRATDAEKKVLELQQKLKESHHQLRLTETHVLGRKQMEEELKEAQERETQLRRQLQEEQRKRKLLDQHAEELQQQLRHSHETETLLAKTHAELQVRFQQQEAQLHILEDEKKTASNEHLHCQKANQNLSEQLSLLQQEKETLHEEYDRLLKQLDIYVRKHNERQLRHKAKLRRAKETFVHEVKQRDVRIKQLESEIVLSRSQAGKEHALIRQITTENENLLQEKRELLQQLNEQEEVGRNNKWIISTIQNRVQFLDEENKRLQESTLQLSSQVGVLERTLRNIQTHSLEDFRSIGFSECQLLSKMLPRPNTSLSATGLPNSLGILRAIRDVKPEEGTETPKSLFSISPSQPSEIGYLNVASPGDTTNFPMQPQSPSFGCDSV
ncbi:EGF-containing fibulin-like extracellular matrix protein 1 [Platysternon megacephalum]|uniref:EGF-containing fibulin-like extracellular matrix protein 1 n=1 Tax=Platysternon megacephalum TaxID=55544 RepID=A0A4D9DSE6_9SAUR|nr:EGF-containing fibulin-like extracellular matrix protein 1 [Platysternon megacephalum]